MQETRVNLALAHHYLDIGQPQRVLEALQHPTSEDLESSEFWFLRGQALYNLDRYAEAAEAARSGLGQNPSSVALLYLLSNCETELGNLAAAEQALLAALQLAPETPGLIARYALLVARAGQFEKAERLAAEAARIDPESPEVARTRALVSYLRGDDKQMAHHSRELLARSPEDTHAHYLLGSSLLFQGKVSDANRHLGTAARYNPSEQAIVNQAREARFRTHWLLWPLRPFERFGPIQVWFAFIVCFFALRLLGLNWLSFILAMVYLVLVIYSWTVPWLLRRWLRR